ncbi:MAG: hypothetical protein RLY77_615 [Pseudomonadota bacterium]
MSKSQRLSRRSAAFQCDWRPSRLLAGGLLALVLLAPLAVLASDLSGWQAWPLALFAGGWGLLDARRYWQRRVRRVCIPGGNAMAVCEDEPLLGLQLHVRGPLVFLQWRNRGGRTRRLVWAPDTLSDSQRRELRLAIQQRAAATMPVSVAG